jgi:hypothetical protein
MENNDSPYIYEKPLRSERGRRGTKLVSFSALGVLGMFGIVGGSALASNLVTQPNTDVLSSGDSVQVLKSSAAEYQKSGNPLTRSASANESPVAASSIISMPFQETKPNPNSVKIELPALPKQVYGNTSSATPTAGAGNSGGVQNYAKSNSYEREDSHGDSGREEHEEHEEHEND